MSAHEDHKTIKAVEALADWAIGSGATRASCVIAVGGGLIGNLAGMLAGLLYRGIRLVHSPTTLLAMLDSALSQKQGVNLSSSKNLLGLFHPPTLIVADLNFLLTESQDGIRSGLCELAKNALAVGVPSAENLMAMLSVDHVYSDTEFARFIQFGIQAKNLFLREDPFEKHGGLIFEYGHTFGHAYELSADPPTAHGLAIGVGMLVEAELSAVYAGLSSEAVDLHRRLLAPLLKGSSRGLFAPMEMLERRLQLDNKKGYLPSNSDEVPTVLLTAIAQPAGSRDMPLTKVKIADMLETAAIVRSRWSGQA